MAKQRAYPAGNSIQPSSSPFRLLIRARKTSEIIADHIRKRIVRGELQEGDCLPPEGQLMESLQISRPTLREAFRILEAEGLINVVRGSRTGARVLKPKVDNVSRYASFVLQAEGTRIADIYEARLATEPFAAWRLASTRNVEAAARLREEVERLRVVFDEKRYVDFTVGLVEFHRLLVELGGNRTLLFVTNLLHNVTTRYQVAFSADRSLSEREQRKRALWGLRSFEKLIELIEAGEPEEAEAHWKLHVANSNESWVPPENAHILIDNFD